MGETDTWRQPYPLWNLSKGAKDNVYAQPLAFLLDQADCRMPLRCSCRATMLHPTPRIDGEPNPVPRITRSTAMKDTPVWEAATAPRTTMTAPRATPAMATIYNRSNHVSSLLRRD